jgi:prepilin-type N-terminal cleavage/methylation domain-containing protein
MPRRKKIAFTLVELLVVISIIALLMSILMPSLGKAREQGRRAKCLANLHAMGTAIQIYAMDHKDLLVPGDYWCGWDAWGQVYEDPLSASTTKKNRQVNLGHLVTAGVLELPQSDDHVFFCPSMTLSAYRGSEGSRGFDYQTFANAWGKCSGKVARAPICYQFNEGLDGFSMDIQRGLWPILFHHDKIHFVRGDGSADGMMLKPEPFDLSHDPEYLQEISSRFEVCFPTIMVHHWLEIGKIDLAEARGYLSGVKDWYIAHGSANKDCSGSTYNGRMLPTKVRIDKVAQRSFVCDAVGSWGGQFDNDPVVPPSG